MQSGCTPDVLRMYSGCTPDVCVGVYIRSTIPSNTPDALPEQTVEQHVLVLEPIRMSVD